MEKKLNVALLGLGFGAEFVPIYLDHRKLIVLSYAIVTRRD